MVNAKYAISMTNKGTINTNNTILKVFLYLNFLYLLNLVFLKVCLRNIVVCM